MAVDSERLLIRIEASTAKLEKQMARALKVSSNAANGIDRRFKAANQNVQRGLAKSSGAMARFGQVTARQRFIIYNSTQQISDMAVQFEQGAHAARIFGQQLPQLLGPMGTIGAVAGTLAAIGIPLVAMFVNTGEAAKDLGDTISDLNAAIAAYDEAVKASSASMEEMQDKYGALSGHARNFLSQMEEIARAEAIKALDATLDGVREKFGQFGDFDADVFRNLEANLASVQERIREIRKEGATGITFQLYEEEGKLEQKLSVLLKHKRIVSDLADQYGITSEQAARLAEAVERFADTKSLEDRVIAADKLRSTMIETLGPIEKMDEAAFDLMSKITEAGERGAYFAQQIKEAENNTASLARAAIAAADGFASMLPSVDSLIGKVRELASSAWNYAAALGQSKKQEEKKIAAGYRLYAQTRELAPDPPPEKPGKPLRTRRSSASRKPSADFIADARNKAELEARLASLQVQALSQTAAAAARARAEYELLARAKKAGLDLDKRQTATGRTLREEIAAQAEAIGRLAETAEKYKLQAEGIEFVNTNLKDAFLDAVSGAVSLGDAMEQLRESFKRAALEAAFFGTGPLSALFGGTPKNKGTGGLFGSLISSLFQPRAQGGPVVAGQPYLVNENTPHSEIFVPSQSGAILNVQQARRALGSGGEVTVRIIPEEGDMFRPVIRAEATGVAVQVVGENNRRVQQAQRRA